MNNRQILSFMILFPLLTSIWVWINIENRTLEEQSCVFNVSSLLFLRLEQLEFYGV